MAFLYDGFVQGHMDTEDWIRRLMESDDPDDKEDLSALCSIVVIHNNAKAAKLCPKKTDVPSWGTGGLTQKRPFSDTAIALVISAAIREGDFELFGQAVAGISSALPELGWRAIGLGIRRHGLDAVQES